LGVQEPAAVQRKARAPLHAKEIGQLPFAYWLVTIAGTVFTLARFSEAFLVIRARHGGLALAWAPAVIPVVSPLYAASAYPAGKLQDRIGARPLLLSGLVALIAADLLLAFGPTLVAIFVGICLWGLHMGLTQGVLAALIAATAPERLRGTAFGLFGLVTGLAPLFAGFCAGLLGDKLGPSPPFPGGGVFPPSSFAAFLFMGRAPAGIAGSKGPAGPI